VALGVAARHVHSHVGMISMTDVEDCVKLVVEVVKRLDKKTVEGFTQD
jgi:putative aminopeptidase FrvX